MAFDTSKIELFATLLRLTSPTDRWICNSKDPNVT